MNRVIAIAGLALAAAACSAPAPDTRATSGPAAAAASAPAGACQPPPKELVTRDLTPGTGRELRTRSAVNVNYTGWVYDGCKPDFKGPMFDTSDGRPTPFGFMVGAGRVIKGWDEGLVGMKEKGKRLLIIPPDKSYGEREVAGGKIPANSTLVFEVTLVEIIYEPEAGK